MMYYSTDGTYEIQLQARGLGKTYAEETFRKLKEIYKGGYTHAKRWRVNNMMYGEFIDKFMERTGEWNYKWNKPSTKEYHDIIEVVYNYHPLQLSKDEIVTLYCIGGLPLLDDMKDIALDYQDYEDNYNEAKEAWDKAQYEWEAALSKYRKDR